MPDPPLPAHAGVSRVVADGVADVATAPRPRGGQSDLSDWIGEDPNRSPPTRGSVVMAGQCLLVRGPLPAHAGVSHQRTRSTTPSVTASRPTRGSVVVNPHLLAVGPPLPAHAGVSRALTNSALAPTAAPRPRGGQSPPRLADERNRFRSPPTRGSVGNMRPVKLPGFPLPAHAGVSRQPRQRYYGAHAAPRPRGVSRALTVDNDLFEPAPRPRGGQSIHTESFPGSHDRSPPTRGSVVCFHDDADDVGPLPAHAGVSRRRRRSTPTAVSRSPPTRGSVVAVNRCRPSMRPLPAHAGVSRSFPQPLDVVLAAPRPRGGQSVTDSVYVCRPDRSPPTRGSVGHRRRPVGHVDPLPAHAGSVDTPTETVRVNVPLPAHAGVSRRFIATWKHLLSAPRPRGGQSVCPRLIEYLSSRSPPTRGSVGTGGVGRGRTCPLPAHAGVSRWLGRLRTRTRIAPRPRGVSRACTYRVRARRPASRPSGGQSDVVNHVGPGLRRSPSTRGSVVRCHRCRNRTNPLPAHAGISR